MMSEASFLALSVELTGFQAFDLRATGLVGDYYSKTVAAVDATALAEIDAIYGAVAEASADERHATVSGMLASAAHGVIVRRIVMLWYTGSWYVAPPYDAATLSSQSYVEGLMWKAIGAHPMAAAPQGYGAWALPPPEAGA